MLAQVQALTMPAHSPVVHSAGAQAHSRGVKRFTRNSPPGSFRQELLEHFGVEKQHRGSHTLPRQSCCTRQGHLHLFIEQQRYTRPRTLDPFPVPCNGSLGPPRGPVSAEQDFGGWIVSIDLPSKPQGFFISSREPVWAGGRLEVDIGVTSESFEPPC